MKASLLADGHTQRSLELAGVCMFCGHDVPSADFPWLFQRHTVHGSPAGVASICPGSRNIYTLDLLGLRELEAEHVPPMRGAA